MENGKTVPQFLDEAEAIVGRFVPSDDMVEILYSQGLENFDEQTVEEARTIYIGALRVLAQQRRETRMALPDTPTNPQDWSESWADSLTVKMLGKICHQTKQERIPLLSAMQKFREKIEPLNFQPVAIYDEEQLISGLRPHQHPYIRDILQFMKEEPQEVTAFIDGEERNFAVHGAAVVAPTGSGKTALAGRTVMGAEIGIMRDDDTGLNKCALIVVPSITLVDQFLGRFGDDTFRRFAPKGVTVGGLHSGFNEGVSDADVVVTTIDQFVSRTKEGLFCDRKFDLLIIDEAHHLLGPQFLQTFLEEWRIPLGNNDFQPIPTIGMTATAAYDSERDIRKVLPLNIEHADTLTYMQEGILNKGQLFLVEAEPVFTKEGSLSLQAEGEDGLSPTQKNIIHNEARQEAIRTAALEFFTPLLEEGRRGIIFCEAGRKAHNAVKLAESLRGITLPTGRKVIAEVLYSKDDTKKNLRVLQAYSAGEVDVITTVGMGQEGFNAEVDFVGVCNVTSMLKLNQIIGRGTRISKKFPTTAYAQFIAGYHDRNGSIKTLFDAFGMEYVEQGVVLGFPINGRVSRLRRDKEKAIAIDDLPVKVRSMLHRIDRRLVREVVLQYNRDEDIPEGYVNFREIYEKLGGIISEHSAKGRLDRAGFDWRGRVLPGEGKQFTFERYYEPAAADFFETRKIPQPVTENQYTINELQTILGVSSTFLEKAELKMPAKIRATKMKRLGRNGVSVEVYGKEGCGWFKAYINSFPVADPTDTSITPLAEEIGLNEEVAAKYAKELGITAEYKRRPNLNGFTWFITAEEAERIKARAQKYPFATSEISGVEICKRAGITINRLLEIISDEDRAKVVIRRTKTARGFVRELRHWPKEDAERIIDYLNNYFESMPAHMITFLAARQLTAAKTQPPDSFKKGGKIQKVRLPGSRAVQAIVWQDLRVLEEKYGRRPGIEPIEYSKLPTGPDDMNVERHVYARSIQLRYMTAERMGNPDGIID